LLRVSSLEAVKVREENTRSRSGKHKRRCLFYVIDKSCSEVAPEILGKEPVKGLYVEGEARIVRVRVPPEAFIVSLDFRVNNRGMIRGDIVIYDSQGSVVARAVYRKLKVRVVETVSPEVLTLLKCVFRKLKLPVKRYGIIRGAVKV